MIDSVAKVTKLAPLVVFGLAFWAVLAAPEFAAGFPNQFAVRDTLHGRRSSAYGALEAPRIPDLAGAVNVERYGEPAGLQPVRAAGSIRPGSSELTTPGRFLPNRWISVEHAGPACGTNWNLVLPHVRTYDCPPGPTVSATPQGVHANAVHNYRIALIDGAGGEGPAGPPISVAGAPANLNYQSWVKLTWAWPDGGVPLAAIYRDGQLVGVSGHQSFADVGLAPITADPNITRTPPTFPLHEHLRTKVSSAAGNTLVLSDAASAGAQNARVFSDDGGMIQRAMDDAERVTQSKSQSGARVVFPPGIFNLATSVITGPMTQGLWLVGTGGSWQSSIVAGPLLIIGDSIGNDAAHGIYLQGLTFSGQGPKSLAYPAEDGLWIFGSQGVNIDDAYILNFPHIGIVGEKPNLPGGGGFWTKVDFLRLRLRYFGAAAMTIGFGHAVDDVSFYRLFESGAGQQVELANPTWGAVYISAAEPTLLVPGVLSNNGFAAALHMRAYGGSISDAHFENNGAGNGGMDLFIDLSQGLRIDGVVFQEGAGQSTCGLRLGNGVSGLLITDVRATISPSRPVQCVIDLGGQHGNSVNTVSFIGPRPSRSVVCNASASIVQNLQ